MKEQLRARPWGSRTYGKAGQWRAKSRKAEPAQLSRFMQQTRAMVEVSAESIKSEIRLVADEVLTNGRGIAENRRMIEENRSAIEECRLGIEVNRSRIVECRSGIAECRSGIADCRSGIEANGRRIDALTHRVGRLENSVTARFADHQRRLRAGVAAEA